MHPSHACPVGCHAYPDPASTYLYLHVLKHLPICLSYAYLLTLTFLRLKHLCPHLGFTQTLPVSPDLGQPETPSGVLPSPYWNAREVFRKQFRLLVTSSIDLRSHRILLKAARYYTYYRVTLAPWL